MNLCLIGCGRIAHLLERDPLRNKPCTHTGGLESVHLRFTHACDTDRSRLDGFARDRSISDECRFSSHKELFRKVSPDLVTIATWTSSHAAIGIAAAEAGAKVIVCEKPVSASLRDAKKLLDACTRSGSILIVNHERRYDPRYRCAKKILESGRIGILRSIHATLPTGAFRGESDPALGGGPLLHDGTHLIDMVRFFAGDLGSVSCVLRRYGRNKGFEDHASALYETAAGVPVFVEAGGAVGYFGFGLELRGTEGMITIGNGFQKLFAAKKSGLYTGFKDLVEVPFPKIPKGNCFTGLYREAKSALHGGKEISSSGMDGYRTLEAIHAAYYSASKRSAVRLPLNANSINIKKIFDL